MLGCPRGVLAEISPPTGSKNGAQIPVQAMQKECVMKSARWICGVLALAVAQGLPRSRIDGRNAHTRKKTGRR